MDENVVDPAQCVVYLSGRINRFTLLKPLSGCQDLKVKVGSQSPLGVYIRP